MMDEKAFGELVDEIQSQGFDQDTAAHYAALIGDLPITDEQGQLVVMSGAQVIARLRPLKFFESD